MRDVMIRRWVTGITVFITVLFASHGFAEQKAEQASEKPIPVTVVSMEQVLLQSTHSVPAQVVGLNHAQLSAQATGIIKTIEAQVGDIVEQGEPLVSLDCRQATLSRALAQSTLTLARQGYTRAQSLRKTRAISEEQLNQAQATLDQSKIAVQQSDIAIEQCVVIAPFKGVVTDRQAQLGALATPGAQMVRFLQIDEVELEAYISPSQLDSLRAADAVTFIDQASNFALALRAALPMLDASNNQQRVRLKFLNDAPLPGSAGDLSWQGSHQQLPVDLIVERGGNLGYFITDADRARFVALPNAVLGHPANIDPQAANFKNINIIREGRFSLRDGSLIAVRKSQ